MTDDPTRRRDDNDGPPAAAASGIFRRARRGNLSAPSHEMPGGPDQQPSATGPRATAPPGGDRRYAEAEPVRRASEPSHENVAYEHTFASAPDALAADPTTVGDDSAGAWGGQGNQPSAAPGSFGPIRQDVSAGPARAAVEPQRVASGNWAVATTWEDIGYRMVQRLGQGGMGEVFLAERAGTAGVPVRCVVKTILAHVGQNVQFRELFLDEARIVSQLRHPNIVSVMDCGRLGDQLYLAMEWIEGLDAAALVDRAHRAGTEVPLPHLLYVLRETLQGLHYAHTAVGVDGRPLNLVHRDISPGNVLISRQGAVKLADFGVAVGTPTNTQGAAENLAGKPHYFAPELWRGARASAQTDVFALGVSFYEMLTLRPLFSRQKGLHGLAVEIAQEFDPRRMIEDNLTLPDGLEPILLGCLATDPAERYPSALEFLEDVNDFAYESGIRLLDVHFASYVGRMIDGVPQEQEGRRRLFKSRD